MYKLAALTCLAIGVFATGIIQLSRFQNFPLTPIGIDFQSKDVIGTLVVNNVKQSEIRGNLRITNGANVPIKLDFSEFLISVGRLSGTMWSVPSNIHYDKSQCEPVLELGYKNTDQSDPLTPSVNKDFLLIEPGLAVEIEIKVLFNQELKGSNLEIIYPADQITWLTDSIA